MNDRLNRLDEINVAVSEYLVQKRAYGTKEFSSFDYSELIQKTLQQMLNKAHKSGTNSVSGSTDVATCEMRPIKPGSAGMTITPCLEAGIRLHEKVHMDACDLWKNNSGIFRGADYRSSMTMSEYLDEEIKAYDAETRLYREQITNLPCKPYGWIGFIRYEDTTRLARSETMPPTEKRLNGRSSSELVTTRSVSIFPSAGEANAAQIYTVKQTENSEYQTKIPCHSSYIVHNFKFSSDISGRVDDYRKPLNFSISQTGPNDYSISFAVGGMTGGTAVTTKTAAPYPEECGQPNKPTTPITGPFEISGGVRYTAHGKGKLSDNKLSGRETIPMLGGLQTITVSWELMRWRDASPNVSLLFPITLGRKISDR
jgi:hypothetical protein